MIRYLMQFISLLAHPLTPAFYIFLYFHLVVPEVFFPIPIDKTYLILIIVSVNTLILPIVFMLIFLKFDIISDLALTIKKERILPFVTISMLYGMTAYLLIEKLYIGPPLKQMMIIVVLLQGLLLIISLRYKISIHAAAVWSVAGVMTAEFWKGASYVTPFMLAIIFIIGGLVGTSRIYMSRHTPDEVWSGMLISYGFCLFMQLNLY